MTVISISLLMSCIKPLVNECSTKLKTHDSAIMYPRHLLLYRFFKEDKTVLSTSIVTGKTTPMALEISLVNSG